MLSELIREGSSTPTYNKSNGLKWNYLPSTSGRFSVWISRWENTMLTKDETEPLVTCILKMPESMARKLDAEAARMGILRGRSAMARRAIIEYLDRQQKQEAA